MSTYKPLDADLKSELEQIVDVFSVEAVLEALAEICQDKAEHIRLNWQDTSLSQVWERGGNSLSGFYAKFSDRYHI